MMKLFLVCLQICLIVTYDIGKYDFYKLNFDNDYIYILISYIFFLMYIIFLIIFKSYFTMKLNKSKKFNTDI